MSAVVNGFNISEIYNGNDYIHTVYKGSDLVFDNTDILKRYIEGSINFAIPSGVTKIRNFSFNSFSQLQSVTIPNSVTSLGSSCFYYCSALQSVTFEEPCQITEIPSSCFSGCSSLTSITIPSSVETINTTNFKYCTNLTTITINKPTDSIAGAPWGATNATIVWNSSSNNP